MFCFSFVSLSVLYSVVVLLRTASTCSELPFHNFALIKLFRHFLYCVSVYTCQYGVEWGDMCLCVCVCVSKRERERGRQKQTVEFSLFHFQCALRLE